jgi:hypothetical protein
MLPLIETIIGFSAIMFALSFLVKSLTSVIKNHFDFYSQNLRHEVYSLLEGTIGISREKLEKRFKQPALRTKLPWMANSWKRLGEKYLTKENITWVLKALDATKVTEEVIKDLEGRLAVHLENVRYMFEKRLKNITLAVGLALCLGLNINAFTIWDKLYNDQDVRAKFSSAKYVDSVMELEKQLKEDIRVLPAGKEKEELKKQREAVVKYLRDFQGQVSFGIGKIWTEAPEAGEKWTFLFLEFLGSLLTGILVSIGAPYWHDLLRALSGLRGKKPEPGSKGSE